MRLARTPEVSRRFRIVTALAAVAVGAMLTGCTHHPLENGFFDPSEVGRFKKQPLLVPIVSTLETGIEEPSEEFSSAADVQPQDLVAATQDYVVGANDLLNISITDLVGPNIETVKTARISESGNVSLPLLGQIKAEGLTESQLEQEIAEGYRRANIITNAQVTVTVAEARARTFSVLGQVSRPGQYQILQSDFRILDALVLAGDVQALGVDYLYVVRRDRTRGGARSTTGPQGTGATTLPSDILAPRSDSGQHELKRAVMLQAAAPADPLSPAANAPATAGGATRPAPAGTLTAEERYGIIDGRPVVAPNQPAATGTLTQPDLLAPATLPAASGMESTAGTGAFEFNNPMGGENVRIIRVPLTELKNGELKYNIVIMPQDMIIAPNPTFGNYWVAGHVQRTGVYSLTGQKITIKQAIDGAGGFDALAVPSRTEIIRRIGKDKEVFAVINMDKVYAGQQPDIFLKPNDQVRVGTAFWAPFLAAARNGFRITYGFGFLYDRNYAPQQQFQN